MIYNIDTFENIFYKQKQKFFIKLYFNIKLG